MRPMQRTILVVDDDPHIRQLLVFALAKVGLQTREAADGEAALASVAGRAPDLVVLDINMTHESIFDARRDQLCKIYQCCKNLEAALDERMGVARP